jgi:hypothetical protein
MKSVMALLFAAALISGASQTHAANQQQSTGVVSDSMCGASHMAKDKTAAECTQRLLSASDVVRYRAVFGN